MCFLFQCVVAGEISNWEIVSVLEDLHHSWDSLVALIQRPDQLGGSADPNRMELLILQESGLALKLHAMGVVYFIG